MVSFRKNQFNLQMQILQIKLGLLLCIETEIFWIHVKFELLGNPTNCSIYLECFNRELFLILSYKVKLAKWVGIDNYK